MKEFVLSYARYRRLGFTEIQAIDFALSRPRAAPILAARAAHQVRALMARAQLKVVK